MRLKHKLLLLAALPLVLSLAVIGWAVRHQERQLAEREHLLVKQAYMAARQTELKHYVDLAVSTVHPLYARHRTDPTARDQALRLLASLDFGDDGYFFVYDLDGTVLMHSRQPELLHRNLWSLQDSHGQPTIQRLLERAQQDGGGFVTYEWRKPSSGQQVDKLGYVTVLPDWRWMIGTGLYLDDIDGTLAALDQQVSHHIGTTLLWIAGIAVLGLAGISASGLWLNLSEHRVADAKQALLARQVVQSQENERAHLARELHDGTSQTLVSAKLMVESAVDQLERGGTAPPPALAKALLRLNDALGEVRELSHRLRPAMLDTLGLPAALALLGREFGEHGGPQVHLQIDETAGPLPDAVTTVLFRIAQEALANTAKHAHARQVQLTLQHDAEGVRLLIADDGRGFDLAAVEQDPQRGIGLHNMQERLASIDGTLALHTAPGQGTRVQARVPAEALQRLQGV